MIYSAKIPIELHNALSFDRRIKKWDFEEPNRQHTTGNSVSNVSLLGGAYFNHNSGSYRRIVNKNCLSIKTHTIKAGMDFIKENIRYINFSVSISTDQIENTSYGYSGIGSKNNGIINISIEEIKDMQIEDKLKVINDYL